MSNRLSKSLFLTLTRVDDDMLKSCESLHNMRHLIFFQHYNNYIFVVISKEDCAPPEKIVVADDIGTRKRAKMLKELESFKEDNAGKRERDRVALWRKLQKFVSRNDYIVNEYVPSNIIIFPSLIHRRVCQDDIIFNVQSINKMYSLH